MPTVPPDVYDRNFGPNYTILYSPENLPGGYNFSGGLGADQYTGYQGDPGNIGGALPNISLADAIHINNAAGGANASEQLAVAQAADAGNLAAGIVAVEQLTTQVAAQAPPNEGGDPVTGAMELASGHGVKITTYVAAGIGLLGSLAALPEIAAGAAIIGGIAAVASIAEGIAGEVAAARGATPGAGYVPNDANTQTFLNDVGRLSAELGRAAAAYFARNPHPQSVGVPGASPHLLAGVGTFTTSPSGQPIFTVPSHHA